MFLFLALKIAAVYSLPPRQAVLAISLAACTGRWMILLAVPAIRPAGWVGGGFHRGGSSRGLRRIIRYPGSGLVHQPWAGAGFWQRLQRCWQHWGFSALAREIGGFTGDVLGFIVEASEVVVLLACGAHL